MKHDPFRLMPGQIIQDSYEIERLLGEGGMGATYKGRNLASGHDVAIKVIGAAHLGSERAVQLFRRESSLLGRVRNDAVIRYEATLQDKQGRLFLIMEYVEGHVLSHYIARRARLPSDAVLDLGTRLADGLSAIHALNIVHRDVSPDNIIVPGDDILSAKLIDFGLASDTVGTEKSIVGDSFAGKISYCAPEQLGLFDGRVTAATDVYALGLVLMRVAGLPVPGEGTGFAGALDARREDLRVEGRSVSPDLKRVLEAMLRADPAKRRTDLEALFREARGGGERLPPEKPGQPVRRWGTLPIAAGLALAIGAAAAAAYFLQQPAPVPSSAVGSAGQAATAAGLLETSGDPLRDTFELIEAGGTENLNAALAALLVLTKNEDLSGLDRRRALIAVAEMHDPETHDTARSPFPQPNPSAAARYYREAADLGSPEALDALARLEE